jgi:signal recognition particle GTPase
MKKKQKIQRKIAKNEFGFDDLSQIQQVKKMGNMKDLVGMIPGASKAMKDVRLKMMLSNTLRRLFIRHQSKEEAICYRCKRKARIKVWNKNRTSQSTDETV